MIRAHVIQKTIDEVIESWGMDDLIYFARERLLADYRDDNDLLIEDACAMGVIKEPEEIE
tara:strand:- start:833 stop:1012 length:180 start_codon:yes stop_codon:yes gene_type:complete